MKHKKLFINKIKIKKSPIILLLIENKDFKIYKKKMN